VAKGQYNRKDFVILSEATDLLSVRQSTEAQVSVIAVWVLKQP
jgi:hypothetical protein